MQIPCSDKNCLGTGQLTWNEETCPAKNGAKHCVDCHGFCPEDHEWTVYCSLCGNCWCGDSREVFAFSDSCAHLYQSKIDDTTSKQEIKIRKALEVGVCPQCFLAEPMMHCPDPECPNNHDEFLSRWKDFCNRPILLGDFTMYAQFHIRVRLEASLYRIPKSENDTTLWSVDTTKFYYKFGDFTKEYDNIDALIHQAKEDIRKSAKRGGLNPHLFYATGQGYGIFAKRRLFPDGFKPRDASPERKK